MLFRSGAREADLGKGKNHGGDVGKSGFPEGFVQGRHRVNKKTQTNVEGVPKSEELHEGVEGAVNSLSGKDGDDNDVENDSDDGQSTGAGPIDEELGTVKEFANSV
mgnify:CR=1 FL=1